MADLSTTYLGLKLKNPLVAAASPYSRKTTGMRKLEDGGVSAIVMFSLFEEQIIREQMSLNYYLDKGSHSTPEAQTYFVDLNYEIGSERYLELIRKGKAELSIPIIASLNGDSKGSWLDMAKMMEEAGADAIELNLTNLTMNDEEDSCSLEAELLDSVQYINSIIKIPLAVKLTPYVTGIVGLATKLVEAGVKGLVLFNRFFQTDLDIETLSVTHTLGLSNPYDLRRSIRWVGTLYSRVNADLALSGGVHSGSDIIKSLMAGANVATTASELLQNGAARAGQMLFEANNWLDEHEYESIAPMIGSMSKKSIENPSAYERANYMKALGSWDNRILN